MPLRDALTDLELLVRSRYGLIHVPTVEDARAGTLLRHLADDLGVPYFGWTASTGLVRDPMPEPIYDTRDVLRAIRHVAVARTPDRPVTTGPEFGLLLCRLGAALLSAATVLATAPLHRTEKQLP